MEGSQLFCWLYKLRLQSDNRLFVWNRQHDTINQVCKLGVAADGGDSLIYFCNSQRIIEGFLIGIVILITVGREFTALAHDELLAVDN